MLLKERGLLVSRRGRTLRLGPFVVLQVEQDRLGLFGRLTLLAAQFENIAPQVPLIIQDQVPRFPHATVSSTDSVRARPRKYSAAFCAREAAVKNARSSARNSSIQCAMYEACRTSLLIPNSA